MVPVMVPVMVLVMVPVRLIPSIPVIRIRDGEMIENNRNAFSLSLFC